MSGVVGGLINSLAAADGTPIHGYAKEITEHFKNGRWELKLQYPEGDPTGYQFIQQNNTAVCVYGAITTSVNEDTYTRVFDDPVKLASEIDGTFLIIGIDAEKEKMIVITDKLGGHPCYFVPNDPVIATSVSACLYDQNVTIDTQAVSDFLLLGHCWGNRTLVNEIKAMRPASVYTFENREWQGSRYWKPSYEEQDPGKAYLNELAGRFTRAVERTADTIPNQAGLWLSGGLDSRNTAAVFSRQPCKLNAYTYNANPPTGDNPAIAHQIGSQLGISVSELDLSENSISPERIERLIDVCDGMVRWNTTSNLATSYDVSEPILFEGVEGSLLGEHLLKRHFTNYDDAVESQLASEPWQSIDVVQNWLSADVDPLETFRRESERTSETSYRGKILDIHFQNYYTRLALASNAVMRDVSGDRVFYNDGEFLEWCAQLPFKYRKGVYLGPKTARLSQAKLELTRQVAGEVANTQYERTKLPPIMPYPLHVLGFVTNAGLNWFRKTPGTGRGQLTDLWLRSDTGISKWSKNQLQNATKRDLFEDNVMELWERHQSGENLSPIISQITTIEWWLKKYID
jgi:asparagine synthase (glutamine-hydrolysing)